MRLKSFSVIDREKNNSINCLDMIYNFCQLYLKDILYKQHTL